MDEHWLWEVLGGTGGTPIERNASGKEEADLVYKGQEGNGRS